MNANKTETGLEIAVIGMAGRFPGANSIDEFWENIKNGVESIGFYSEEELLEAGIDPDLLENQNYVKSCGGVIEEKEYFDATFFGYSAAEAELMDPQVRVFHECAWHALEDACYDPLSYKGLIGLYAGASLNLAWEAFSILSERVDVLGGFTVGLLIDRDYLCTRVSYNFNLKGPSVVVKSACSTSLVAVHMACQAILNGECDMALAGGVTLTRINKSGYTHYEDLVVSRDGHCRSFDAQASGTVFGDAVGVVVLKRLEEALADKDNIYAVIKGTAINNDGVRKAGYTAPSIIGQSEVIADAMQMADVSPESISYVEAHGSGTAVGDPIELESLKMAFDTDQKGFCCIGSVKTNVGHLDCAAGVAGLIKVVMALKHQLIPANVHFETPNPKFDFANSPFYVNSSVLEWKRNGYPLRAGVSSFGIGGTNAHAVLEEWPPEQSAGRRAQSDKSRPQQLILLSARTQSALDRMTRNLGEYFEKNKEINLADAAYTLQVGRRSFSHRRMLVCDNVAAAIEALTSPDSGKMRTFHKKEDKHSIIFMFPGLGAQYVNMGWELYQTEPQFRETMDHCFDILKPLLGYDLKEILYPRDSVSEENESHTSHTSYTSYPQINRFEIAQLVVFILQYALAQLLIKWGIKPRAMIGYSFGEYTAACISGVFSLEEALKLIAARGQLIARISGGSMMSVPLPLDQLKPLMNDDLSIAIDNGPSCIVAGPDKVIDIFDKQLKAKRLLGMKLDHSQAVHSKMMEPVLKEFENHVRQVQLNRPQIPFISNVTGQWITVQEAGDPGYWTRHLREMVRFADGIEELRKESNPLFIEIGPGRDLKALLARYQEEESTFQVVNLIRPQQQEGPADRYFLDKIGRLWLYGVDIDWQEFYSQEMRLRIPLPTYPFDRQRFWFEGNPFRDRMMFRQTIPPRKIDISDWFYIPQWERSALPVDIEPAVSQEQPCWLLFVNESRLASQLVKGLKRDNQEMIIVRAGSAFEAVNPNEYTINPTQNNDYNHLFAELLKSKKVPRYIAHLWGVTAKGKLKNNVTITLEELDRSQDLGLYSLLNIAQAIGNNSIEQDICLGVITDNMQPVTGEEELCPEKATILGPIKVIPLEYPNIKCLSIDIMDPGSNRLKRDFIFHNLTREFSADFNDYRVVAYRGTYRWLESYEPIRLNHSTANSKKPVLREKGVYLVTGGFGGMGFTLARHLAQTLNARLILVDILDTALKEGHEQWLSSEKRKKDINEKMQKIKEWENNGIEIEVHNADVSDYDRMKEVIARSEERFGNINGVIHTAGIIDYSGVIQRRTRQMTETLLDAKVRGTLVLDSLLEKHQLDFMVLFSSIGNLFHKLKFGQVAYNAGHEFMDVFAYHKQKQGSVVAAIDWNDWTEVGMAVRAQQERSNPNAPANPDPTQDFLSISPTQGIDVFERIIANDFCRVIVFSRDLAPVLEFMSRGMEEQEDIADALGGRESSGRLHDRPELDSEYVAPTNEREHALADMWQNFFAINQVGIQDDFFELGGDSLLATTMVSRINQQLGIRIPLAEVYNRPTIQQLAEYMESKAIGKFKGVHEKLVLFQEGSENAPNFFFIHTGYAEVDVYFELSSRLNSDFTYWGVQADTITNYAPINLTFEEIAENNIKKIRTVQPHGPYYISGWCLGGKFAFEVVRQLEQMNEEVKLFLSIDSPAPQRFPSIDAYTLEEEIKGLAEAGIPEEEIRKKIGDITEINQLWPIIVDYIEQTAFDINILRQMVHPTMVEAFPNFYELTARELVFFLNTSRTFLRAEYNYHPVGKINAMTYSFEALEGDVNTYEMKWRDYCQSLRIYEIPGDHFSIFRMPDVTTFAETCDKAVQELG